MRRVPRAGELAQLVGARVLDDVAEKRDLLAQGRDEYLELAKLRGSLNLAMAERDEALSQLKEVDAGRIAEVGAPLQLLDAGGHFSKMADALGYRAKSELRALAKGVDVDDVSCGCTGGI